MPESFERAPSVEKEKKSPEQVREEESLGLVREIEEIKERMVREGETAEDYREIMKLLKEIESLFPRLSINSNGPFFSDFY